MPNSGYIYLIAAKDMCSGIYKIGKANDPKKRIRALTKMPFGISLAHVVKCDNVAYVESRLHDFFREFRRNGEWFSLSGDQVKLITSCNSQADILELTGHQVDDTGQSYIQKTIRFDKTIFSIIAEDAKKEDRSFNVHINRLLRDALWDKLKCEVEKEPQAS